MIRYTLFAALLSTVFILNSCTPNRGCTELTADNYDLNAEEDDGTCIAARDKFIGNFVYSKFWTDVISGSDLNDVGELEVTEANTAHNAFVTNFDGELFLQGVIAQNDIVFELHSDQTSSYNGTGTWLENDTVDAVFNITYTSEFLPAPQPFVFYCKKTP